MNKREKIINKEFKRKSHGTNEKKSTRPQLH